MFAKVEMEEDSNAKVGRLDIDAATLEDALFFAIGQDRLERDGRAFLWN